MTYPAWGFLGYGLTATALFELPGTFFAGAALYWGIRRYSRLAAEDKIRVNPLLFILLFLPIALELLNLIDVLLSPFSYFALENLLMMLPYIPCSVVAVQMLVRMFRGEVPVWSPSFAGYAIGGVSVISWVFLFFASSIFAYIAAMSFISVSIALLLISKILVEPESEDVSLYAALATYWVWSGIMQVFHTTICSNCDKTVMGFLFVTTFSLEMLLVCGFAYYLIRRGTIQHYRM